MRKCGYAGQGLQLLPLAAGLALAGFAVAARAESLSAAMPASWKPGDGHGVAALFAALEARSAARPATPGHVASTLTVTSCADDGGGGTLRAVVTVAGDGDIVNASTLTCSQITLTHGAIPVYVNDLTIAGPGATALAIDGAGVDRVFAHYGRGTLDLQNLTLRNGMTRVYGYHVTGGACVISNGTVRLDHDVVSGCLAVGEGAYGGGITARGVSLYASTLSGNTALGSHPNTFTAAYGGGAMAYRGLTHVYQSTITGNRATHTLSDTHGSYCTGGGIFSDLGGYVYGSTLSNNYSYGTGGGLATHGPFGIANTTLAANTARFKSGGGAFMRVLNPTRIDNSTIAANESGTPGAGIYFVGAANALTISSSIVAGNRTAGANDDIAAQGPITISGSNNLVMAASANATLPAGTILASPLLAPLAGNGGPTQTMGLYPGSPAFGAGGNPRNFANDQRGPGFPRTTAGLTDIGAFQGMVAAPLPPVAVPSQSAWTLGLLAGLLGFLGWRPCRFRRGVSAP